MYGKLFDEKDIPAELRQYFEEVETECGAPWRRVVDRLTNWQERKTAGAGAGNVGVSPTYQNGVHGKGLSHDLGTVRVEAKAWQPSCKCSAGAAEPVPATILDPFSGAGTTAVAALRLGRSFVGIELSQEYVDLSLERIRGDMPLFFAAMTETAQADVVGMVLA